MTRDIPRRIALFDLDHTLLPLDSDYQWADFLARTGRAGDPAEAQRRNEDLMDRYNAGQLTAEQSYEFMLGLLTRGDLTELDAWRHEFMRDVISPALLPQAHELVERHRSEGDLLAIVTATNSYVTAPIAAALNIPTLIATLPEMRDGRYTGRVDGTPCFQAGKIVRVNEWLATLGLTLNSFEQSWFYSDSLNDLPLLETVTHPVATNPSAGLRELANARGWPTIDLFLEQLDAKS